MPRRLPENTLPSFAEALAVGADGIELDVHSTSDGVVIVHHDAELPDGAEIAGISWARARSTPLPSGASIPTLAEVCELVHGRAELFVEIKGAGIEEAVLDVLRTYPGTAAIHSFDHALIGRVARRASHHRLGLLVEETPGDLPATMALHGALDLWPHWRIVTPQLVGAVHALGGRVIPWTVNDPRDAARLTSWGVDGLCTDDVSMLG